MYTDSEGNTVTQNYIPGTQTVSSTTTTPPVAARRPSTADAPATSTCTSAECGSTPVALLTLP